MNPKEQFLAHLDGEIRKYEESADGWRMLRDHGNFPEESDAQIRRCREYAAELRALKKQVEDLKP